ncbi:MAG: murein DD-endopeptidase MepM/ murein hydrolase activator NlpD [Gammaproteobacteria bacterium]|jgi:murein DD-endopeptidase MepM/ murein hydrolase activator NlpD
MGNKLGLLNVDLKGNVGFRHYSSARPKRKRIFLLAIPLFLISCIGLSLLSFGGDGEPEQDSAETFSNYDQPAKTAAENPRAPSLTSSDNLYSSHLAPSRIAPSSPITPTITPTAPPRAVNIRQSATVATGDSLLGVFERLGLNVTQWYSMRDVDREVKRLTEIRPGDTLNVIRTKTGELVELAYKYSQEYSLIVSYDGDTYKAETLFDPIERDIVSASGTITDSFYLSAKRSGLEDKQIMELAELFAWDINFALDVWNGDSFSVLYERLSQDEKFIGYGDIVAAEFNNRQREIQTVRFTDEDGDERYYTPEGRSMRRAFLQSPVHFTRISSGFSLARLHPIHKTRRPHRGVDYAAAKGTKIMASGDGVVEFVGRQNGYGQTVILRHGKRYTTLYAHMSKFANLRKGSRVKQGQTIGYVGKTGAATGDHLHYEFRVDGKHKNPLTVKLPPAAPIGDDYRNEFATQTEPLLGWLNSLSDKRPAIAGGSDNSVAAPLP